MSRGALLPLGGPVVAARSAGRSPGPVLPERAQTLVWQVAQRGLPPLFIVDLSGALLYVNESCEKHFGSAASVEASVSQGSTRLIRHALEARERFLSGEEKVEQQLAVDAGTDRRFYRVTYTPLRDEGGAITAVCGLAEDRTQLVKALDVAIKTKSRFGDVLRSISDWVWECDAGLRLSFLSDRATAVLGHPAQDLIGRPLAALLRCVGPAPTDGLPTEIRDMRPFRNVVVEIVDRKGHARRNLLSGVPVFDDDGRFQGYRGTGSDVTAHYEAASQLTKLSQAVDQSPNAVMITDTGGRIEYVNARYAELTGYTAQEAIGKSVFDLEAGAVVSAEDETVLRTLRDMGVWQGELEQRRKDGTPYWAAVSISPIRGPDGAVSHFLAIKEDISQRKRMEREIVTAHNQAQAANRSKSQFLANMSHELRTPLNAIIGFSEIIRDKALGGEMDERYSDYAQDINISGRHLLDLVNEILDLSKIEAGHFKVAPETVNLEEICRDLLRLMKVDAEKRDLRLHLELSPDLPPLYADVRGLKKIILNLLSNAIKFTHAGGQVHLSAVPSADGEVTIAVSDTGVGIPPDQIERVLLPFEQVDNQYSRSGGGTGLGLALIKGLMELHGGRIEIDSEVGKGTTVTVSFPPHEPAEADFGAAD